MREGGGERNRKTKRDRESEKQRYREKVREEGGGD